MKSRLGKVEEVALYPIFKGSSPNYNLGFFWGPMNENCRKPLKLKRLRFPNNFRHDTKMVAGNL